MGTINLNLEAQSVQPSGNSLKFGGVAYSGGVIPNYGYFGDIALDLSDAEIANGGKVVLLYSHAHTQVIGKANISLLNGQIIVNEAIVATDTEEGKRIAAVRGVGFEWKYSVGVSAKSFDQFEKKTTVELNGQTLELDGIMRGIEIFELSLVWEGADPEAHALNLQKGNGMDVEKVKADLRLEFEAQTLQLTAQNEALKLENDALKAELQAKKDAEAQALVLEHGIDLAVAMELVGLSAPAKALLFKKDSKKPSDLELTQQEPSAQDKQFAFAMASMKGAV